MDRTAAQRLLLEVFIAGNFAFLVLDIFSAHSVNRFRHPAEWVPFGFSAVAAVAVGLCAWTDLSCCRPKLDTGLGCVVGVLSVIVGLSGVLFHLESQFFQRLTIASLVYTAPFAAPLAYSGLGLLLLLNRMVPVGHEWSRWIVFLAIGGFVGNFALSLADHAQNGFFQWSEWIPVVASAVAIGFLTTALWDRTPPFLKACLGVLVMQALVGIAGFVFHLMGDVQSVAVDHLGAFIHGAPAFAPLLFTNLAVLGGFGIWNLRRV